MASFCVNFVDQYFVNWFFRQTAKKIAILSVDGPLYRTQCVFSAHGVVMSKSLLWQSFHHVRSVSLLCMSSLATLSRLVARRQLPVPPLTINLAITTSLGFRWLPQSRSHNTDIIVSAVVSQITGVSMFAQPFVKAQIKENAKALRHWLLWGESTRWPGDSPHKGTITQKKFPFDDVIVCAYIKYRGCLQLTGSAWRICALVMACRTFGARPLITSTNSDVLSVEPSQTNFSGISFWKQIFSFKKMLWKCRQQSGGHFCATSTLICINPDERQRTLWQMIPRYL